ncbi:MAG: thioredoxin family protein [Candidatus Sulfotelmatobacter sp.]
MNANMKLILAIVIGLACPAWSQTPPSSDFAPLQQWKNAVIAGDPAALKALYSSDPAAEIEADGAKTDADGDVNFWTALKARSLTLEIVRETDHPDRHGIILKAAADSGASGKTVNVTYAVSWQKQGDQWRIRGAERTDAPHLKQPSDMKKDIYPAGVDAHAEIKEAEEKGVAGHKRLLLVFGANWCFDCHVLDLAFQRPDLAPILRAGYEVVHVDLGDDEKKNADLVRQYEIPLNKGIPALAVVDSDGKLIVSQKNGEFEDARSLTPEALSAFLSKWKPE